MGVGGGYAAIEILCRELSGGLAGVGLSGSQLGWGFGDHA